MRRVILDSADTEEKAERLREIMQARGDASDKAVIEIDGTGELWHVVDKVEE